MRSTKLRTRTGPDSASSWGLPAARFAPACGLCSEPCSEPSRRDKSDESDPQKRRGRVCHKPCHKPLFLFADRAAKKGGSLSSFPAPLLLARDGLVVAGKPLRGKEIDKMSAATKKCRFLPQSPPYISGKKDRHGHRARQAQKRSISETSTGVPLLRFIKLSPPPSRGSKPTSRSRRSWLRLSRLSWAGSSNNSTDLRLPATRRTSL